MAALSKVIKVGDFYARVAGRCKQVDDFVLDETALCNIIGMEIITNFTAAHSSIRRDYQTHEALTVATADVKSTHIDLSSKSYFDITDVSFGMDRLYHPAKSVTEFISKQAAEAHEQKKDGRYWLTEAGNDRILIFKGTEAVAANENTLNVWVIRYPDISTFNMDAVKANALFVDLPTWAIPFTVTAAAISAIKEQDLPVPQNLANEMTGIIAGLSDKMAKEEIELQRMRLTNATK